MKRIFFFGKLGSQLDHFPKHLCTQKILPNLVTALDYGYANSRALGPLLKIGAQLSAEDYADRITPSVAKWFGSADREMRTNLLSNIESFADHLTPSLVNEKIFPNLALGFSDVSPKLRELTIRSIVVLAPKLNSTLLNMEVMQHFARLQLDKEPFIRTNTTICLGRIAKHLAPATRQKVLASAFGRALRDPFPPARVAGLMSFIGFSFVSAFIELSTYFHTLATNEYYGPEEIARKVIPCFSTLSLDSEKQVRMAALQGMRLFLEKLEKHSDSMASPGSSGGSEPAPDSAGAEGILGWALGSITGSLAKKFYGDTGEAAEGMKSTPVNTQQTLVSQNSARAHHPDTANRPSIAIPVSSENGWNEKEEGWNDDGDEWNKDGGGWGSDDDWGGIPNASEDEDDDDRSPKTLTPLAASDRVAVSSGATSRSTGILGLRRAEKTHQTSSSIAIGPLSTKSTFNSLLSTQKAEPIRPSARSISSPDKPSLGNNWDLDDSTAESGGWDNGGWGDEGDDDEWDILKDTKPISPTTTKLSKLEERAMRRNQKAGSKKD